MQEYVRRMIQAPVWATAPVEAEPERRLADWQVYTVRTSRYFVGYNQSLREGRISTAIQSFDPRTRRGATASAELPSHVGPSSELFLLRRH